MRAPIAVALTLLLAGCSAPLPHDVPLELCPAPCEVSVDDGPERAFEPTAALSPTNADHAVIVSTVFGGDNETGHPWRMKVHVTDNRGSSFDTYDLQASLPPDHLLSSYQALPDPMLHWHSDGSLLLFGMGGRSTTVGEAPGPKPPLLAVTAFDLWVARSDDGGRTFPEAQVIARGLGLLSLANVGTYQDQPFVSEGPNGELLLGWVEFTSNADQSTRLTPVAAASVDGGRTWSEPVAVAEGSYHNARPAAGASTWYMAYRDYGSDGPERPVGVSLSVDHGATWDGVPMPPLASVSRPSVVAHDDGLFLLAAPLRSSGAVAVELWHYDGAGGWTNTTLDRMADAGEPLVALAADADGGLWGTWHRLHADGARHYLAWHRDAAGAERLQRIDAAWIGDNGPVGLGSWPSLGDYHGLDAVAGQAVAAWVSGAGAGQDVRAAFLGDREPGSA